MSPSLCMLTSAPASCFAIEVKFGIFYGVSRGCERKFDLAATGGPSRDLRLSYFDVLERLRCSTAHVTKGKSERTGRA